MPRLPREERRSRITLRLRERLEHQDMIGEVKGLLTSGIPAEDLIYYGLEYKLSHVITRFPIIAHDGVIGWNL